MSDIEIAQQAVMQPIADLAEAKFGIHAEYLESYGRYKAKVSLQYIERLATKKEGKLILVTAISPTPAGEGKTTTTIGLGDAMNRLGKKTIICLREPSLGPCFGIKGGATGGGYSQVVPMADINLHFTGDFAAVCAAHNLLAAMLDNHLYHGNALNINPKQIVWRRVVDMNDRALRNITLNSDNPNGYPRKESYDIVAASEIMAILCLATHMADLKERLGRIVVAYKTDNITPIYARDLNAQGAMTVLLKDAIKPNLVQTLANNIAIIHGGPFANIAHGCNTVIATKTALKLADYTLTEAGFGADLGAEKFINIKCRMADLSPSVVVLVVTIRALKFHGGIAKEHLNIENLTALKQGFANLQRHLHNLNHHCGLSCVVCINHFAFDSDAEITLLQQKCRSLGIKCIVSKHWEKGGEGAEALAQEVIKMANKSEAKCTYVYDENMPLWDKIKTIATKFYGAKNISASSKIHYEIKMLQKNYAKFPICIAKTQMSFSTDPTLKGAPSNHTLKISEVRLASGAGFIVVVAGNMTTMPGLPKTPAAEHIDIDNAGQISGLS